MDPREAMRRRVEEGMRSPIDEQEEFRRFVEEGMDSPREEPTQTRRVPSVPSVLSGPSGPSGPSVPPLEISVEDSQEAFERRIEESLRTPVGEREEIQRFVEESVSSQVEAPIRTSSRRREDLEERRRRREEEELQEETLVPLLEDATDNIKFLKSVIENVTSRMTTFDVIMAEEVLVSKYLSEDPNHVVFLVGKLAYGVDKTSIDMDDTFHECKSANGHLMQSRENVVDTELVNLRKIGGSGFVPLNEISRAKRLDSNLYVLEKVRDIPTVVSRNVLLGGSVVSAMHCQPGFDDILYKISTHLKIKIE